MSAKIKRKKEQWGMQLTIQPLPDLASPIPMQITADLVDKSGRRPEVTFRFNGVPPGATLRYGDIRIWIEAMTSLVAEAQTLAAKK